MLRWTPILFFAAACGGVPPELASTEAAASGDEWRPDPFAKGCYLAVDPLTERLQAIARDYPRLAAAEKIGLSTRGRPIWALRLGYGPGLETRPTAVFTAGIHGNEYQGPELALAFAEALVGGWAADADLHHVLATRTIWIVPLVNPDGYEARGDQLGWRTNANSVDLNRNFPFHHGWATSALDPGPGPGSEVETQVVLGLLDRVLSRDAKETGLEPSNPKNRGVFVDIHSATEDLRYPYAHEVGGGPADLGNLIALAWSLAQHGNTHAASWTSHGAASGTAQDHVYATYSIPAFTLELEGWKKRDCATEKAANRSRFLPLLVAAAKLADRPWQRGGPNVTALAATEGTRRIDATVEHTTARPVASASATILSFEWEEERWITNPAGGCEGLALAPIDGRFDAPLERVKGGYSTTCLRPMTPEMVVVEARDADGRLGLPRAAFVLD